MTTVLITGFGRFPGAPFNPSAPLARAVAKRRRPALADVRRVLHIFETSYAAVDRDYPVMFATLYFFTLLGLVMTIIRDITYHWVDPRIDFESRDA